MKFGSLGSAAVGVAALLAVVPARSQILPKDAAEPVEVVKGTGDFAGKLNGARMPTGKGWKAVSDPAKRLQLMVPDKWRVDITPSETGLIRVFPPSPDKRPQAKLVVTFSAPRNADPLDVDEAFATNYAEDLVKDKNTESFHLKTTDSGFVRAHGMHFALGGWTMISNHQAMRQEQLVYISEDRIVTVQFACHACDFEKYEDEIARIFASYENLGVLR